MTNITYREAIRSNLDLTVKADAREVIFDTVSCMCDNKAKIRFSKKENGDFTVRHYNAHCNLAFSNLQLTADIDSVLWDADEQDWDSVIRMLNTGVVAICGVKSR